MMSLMKSLRSAMRGALEKAAMLYDELKSKFPDSFYATYASKRATEIRTQKAELERLNQELAMTHAKIPPAPAVPSLPAPITPPPVVPTPPATNPGPPAQNPPQ